MDKNIRGMKRRRWEVPDSRLILTRITRKTNTKKPLHGTPKDIENRKLLNAAKNRDVDKLIESLEMGADVDSKDEIGWSPIFWAVKNNDEVMIDILIFNDAELDIRDKTDSTPAIIAAEWGYSNIIDILGKEGANLEIEDRYKRTALRLAMWNSDKKILKVLKKYWIE